MQNFDRNPLAATMALVLLMGACSDGWQSYEYAAVRATSDVSSDRFAMAIDFGEASTSDQGFVMTRDDHFRIEIHDRAPSGDPVWASADFEGSQVSASPESDGFYNREKEGYILASYDDAGDLGWKRIGTDGTSVDVAAPPSGPSQTWQLGERSRLDLVPSPDGKILADILHYCGSYCRAVHAVQFFDAATLAPVTPIIEVTDQMDGAEFWKYYWSSSSDELVLRPLSDGPGATVGIDGSVLATD